MLPPILKRDIASQHPPIGHPLRRGKFDALIRLVVIGTVRDQVIHRRGHSRSKRVVLERLARLPSGEESYFRARRDAGAVECRGYTLQYIVGRRIEIALSLSLFRFVPDEVIELAVRSVDADRKIGHHFALK